MSFACKANKRLIVYLLEKFGNLEKILYLDTNSLK